MTTTPWHTNGGLEDPDERHFCQIHQKESSLIDAAVKYLLIGFTNRENLVLITRRNRQKLILDWLAAKNVDVENLIENRRLFVFTSAELVNGLFVDGVPDWQLFEPAVSAMLEEASWAQKKAVRIYGDAVSDLWQTGNHAAAMHLESSWNRLRMQGPHRFSLFCGYLIEALNPLSYSDWLAQLGNEHDFVIPAPDDLSLRCALDEAGREILGVSPSSMLAQSEAMTGNRLPLAFRMVLWLRERHGAATVRVLERARQLYAHPAVDSV